MNASSDKSKPIVLGITGASGAVYGFTLLKFFLDSGYKVDLVLSDNALKVAKQELDLELNGLSLDSTKQKILEYLFGNQASAFNEQGSKQEEALTLWSADNVAASISSGSYKTQGMIIAPCSMGTIANIAAGTSNNLIARAADVCLKERRKLVILARETPFSNIHLRNMLSLSEMGAVILPAAPGFYHKPQTIQDQINFVLGKTLDVLGIENEMFTRWTGDSQCKTLIASL